MKKAIFKFNNGNGALLCSNCFVIIKVGSKMTDLELEALKGNIKLQAQYCDKCLKKRCPNCDHPWNGIECNQCSFDAYCFDPHWD